MKALIGWRVRWIGVIALWIVAASGLIVFAQAASENPGIHVTRSLSAAHALPESTFQVTLELRVDADLQGVGIQETLPFGWSIHPVENAGAVFKRSEAEWVFGETLTAGNKHYITYEVTVPAAGQLMSDPLPQCFAIRGTYQTTVPSYETTIAGESTIEIGTELPIGTVISHLIPQDVSGADIIDLRLSRLISETQLKRALEFWQHDLPVPGTAGQRIDLATMNHLAAQFETCTRTDDALPVSIDPQLHAVRTLETFLPCDSVLLSEGCLDPGLAARQVTVRVRITPSFDAYGVGLKEWLPTAWRVTPIYHNGFIYRPSEREWIYPTKLRAGETVEIIYAVEVVPTSWDLFSASGSCCGTGMRIVGEASAGLECSVAPVIGEDTVLVQTCVPVLLAISRWDVDNDRFDARLSNTITRPQMQRAIAFWEESAAVPHTCGYTVGWHMLKLITAYWQTETPITQALPAGVLETCGDPMQECGIPDCVDGSLCGLVNAQDPDDYVGIPEAPTVVVDGGADRILTCAQPSVTLSAGTTGGIEPFTFEWRDSTGETVGNERTLSVHSPGTYTVIAGSCGGCLAVDTVTITEDFSQPVVSASASDILTGYVTEVVLSATISAGTGPFAIEWRNSLGEFLGQTQTMTVSQPDLYTVTVTGSNGCLGSASVLVLQDVEPPVVQVNIIPDLEVSVGPADAVLTCAVPEIVMAGQIAGGREPYTLVWTNGQGEVLGDAETMAVRDPGDYVLTVTGSNGIGAHASVMVAQDIVAPSVAIAASGELTCATKEVSLTTTVTSGHAPFTYQWTNDQGEPAGSDSSLDVTEPGTYTVDVTGCNGCSVSASSVVKQNIEPPVVGLAVSGVLTCAVSEVTVFAEVSGGRAPYSITWIDSSGHLLGESTDITVSSPGVVTAIVVGDNGCSTEASITVEQDIEPPVVTATVDGILTCSIRSVNLHANVVGGRAPLAFKWTNEAGQTIGTSVGLPVSMPGIYTIQVTGTNGCVSSDRVIVTQDTEAPVVTVSVSESLTCSVTEVQLTSTVSGGHAPYSYVWTGPGGATLGETATLAVSTPGTYTLEVAGANGCQTTTSITVEQDIEPPVITVLTPDPLTCALTEVRLSAVVADGRAPYSYIWMDASEQIISQSEEATVSMPGTYSVVVMGANGCQATASTSVVAEKEPPVVTIPNPEVLTCAVSEVTVCAEVSGGRAPYTYTWANEAGQEIGTDPQITVCDAGCYTVIVTGANGCETAASIAVQQDIAPPVITIPAPEDLTCSASSVTLTSCVSGGHPPYTYAWSNMAGQEIGTDPQITVCDAGCYTVIVTGANGCQASASVSVVEDKEPPVVTIPNPEVLTCAVSEVTVCAEVSGGRAPYVYSWANEAGQEIGTDPQITVSNAGWYTVIVTGANGCETDASIAVQQDVAPPVITISDPEDLTCSVSSVTLTSCVSGGRPPYTYAWSDIAGQILGCSAMLLVTEPGTYSLTVTGANGCTSSACVVVQEDIAPPCVILCETQILTCAQPTVFIDVEVCGGRAPFTYQWTDVCDTLVATTEDVTLCVAGVYTLTVTGANGCSTSRSIEVINGINPPIVDAGPDQILVCVGDEAVLDATVSGGSLPYTYTWVNSCGDIVGTCEDLVTTLPGIYILTVQSADGCISMDSVSVEVP